MKKVKMLVLVIEDEKGFATKLKLLRRRSKHNIELDIVQTADEAVERYKELIKSDEPALVAADYNLKTSNRNGADAVVDLKEVGVKEPDDDIPIFVISTSRGDLPYNQKPFRKEFEGMTEREAAEAAGAVAWCYKGGKDLIGRFDLIIDDYVIGNKKEFGYYE